MFFKRKIAKRLAKIGSMIDITYMLYVNNEKPMSFPSYDDVVSYLKEYRSNNAISRLQIFRIETYSL